MTRILLMLMPLVWLAPACPAEARQRQMRWGELAPLLTNRKVSLMLPDGTHIQGKVIDVETDGLRLKISRSSNRKVQPKGKHLIPRQAVSVLQLTKYRTRGRIIGTVAAVGVAAAIVGASYPDVYEGPTIVIVPAVTAGGLIGAAIGGYYAGKAFDKTVTEIRIVP